jgi:hypothetical protein
MILSAKTISIYDNKICKQHINDKKKVISEGDCPLLIKIYSEYFKRRIVLDNFVEDLQPYYITDGYYYPEKEYDKPTRYYGQFINVLKPFYFFNIKTLSKKKTRILNRVLYKQIVIMNEVPMQFIKTEVIKNKEFLILQELVPTEYKFYERKYKLIEKNYGEIIYNFDFN